MKANIVFFGEFSEANDIILAAIGEVDSRTHNLKKIIVSLKYQAKKLRDVDHDSVRVAKEGFSHIDHQKLRMLTWHGELVSGRLAAS